MSSFCLKAMAIESFCAFSSRCHDSFCNRMMTCHPPPGKAQRFIGRKQANRFTIPKQVSWSKLWLGQSEAKHWSAARILVLGLIIVRSALTFRLLPTSSKPRAKMALRSSTRNVPCLFAWLLPTFCIFGTRILWR